MQSSGSGRALQLRHPDLHSRLLILAPGQIKDKSWVHGFLLPLYLVDSALQMHTGAGDASVKRGINAKLLAYGWWGRSILLSRPYRIMTGKCNVETTVRAGSTGQRSTMTQVTGNSWEHDPLLGSGRSQVQGCEHSIGLITELKSINKQLLSKSTVHPNETLLSSLEVFSLCRLILST